MRYAVLKADIVANVVLCEDPDHAAEQGWIKSTDAQIGDVYDGEQFKKPQPPPADPKQVQADATVQIQLLLDSTALEHGYDSIISLCSYAESSNPEWKTEGTAGRAWRDACWMAAQKIQDDVIAGKRPLPTVDEVLAEMPAIVWPASQQQ